MGNTSVAGCKLAMLEFFGDVMAAVSESMSLAPTQTVEWCGKCILTTLLTNPPAHLVRAILWEVYKIGWHYELCALNQALNPQLWKDTIWSARVSFKCSSMAVWFWYCGLSLCHPMLVTSG